MSDLKIICDSLSDLPKNLIEKYDVEVIPLTIILNGVEYKHGVDLSDEEFYKIIRSSNEMPKTSQATYAQFEEVFKKYIEQNKSILYISASSKITGTYQSAMMAKNELDGDIHLFDSLSASFGIGSQVLAACEMNEKNYSIDEILEKLECIRDNVFVIFAVDTLDYLHKGGRLSTSKAVIGSILSMKPILTVEDGFIKNLEVVRGTKKELLKMVDMTKDHIEDNLNNKRIAIGHGDNLHGLERLEALIKEEYVDKELLHVEIGASIGSHAGPGTLGICVWDKLDI